MMAAHHAGSEGQRRPVGSASVAVSKMNLDLAGLEDLEVISEVE